MIYKFDKNNLANSKLEKPERKTPKELKINEKNIEDYIARNITQILPVEDLMIIYQERRGQEAPDIMAMNRFGDLYIFELKRTSSQEENILQLLRYAQKFGVFTYNELNEMYNTYNNNSQRKSLIEDLKNAFGNTDLKEININKKQHFYLVTNGADKETIEKIKFWNLNGLNLDLIIYWIFKIGNEYFIEFNVCKDLDALLEYEKKYYIVNTNSKNTKDFSLENFLKEKKVAIQGNIKERIKTFKKGDIIFLYQNTLGIVAYGEIESEIFKKATWNKEPDEEYYMNLTNFKQLDSDSYLKKAEIDKICKREIVLSPTIIYLSEIEGRFLKEEIDK